MKIYQKPSTELFNVMTVQMIAASGYGKPEEGFNLDEVTTTDETSGNLSRRHSVWDDQEEEEEELY